MGTEMMSANQAVEVIGIIIVMMAAIATYVIARYK